MGEFVLDTNKVMERLYNELVELGYAPTSDEVLDLGELVVDLIIEAVETMGVPVEIMEDDEDANA